MNSKQTFVVIPTAYVYGGETIARLPDGRAVFIPYSIPGEKIEIRLVEDKERFARAEIVKIIEASPQRIDARCSHFQECGGCHYQHLSYQQQLDLKADVLRDQLQRLGKIEDPPVDSTVPSPTPWRYRNQIQFQISPQGKLGFNRHRSHQIVPIQECYLPDPVINLIWPEVAADPVPGMDRITIRSGEEGEDALLILESSDPQPVEFSLDLTISAVHQGPGGDLILAGDDFTIQEIFEFPFVVSAGSFFQVNNGAAERLVSLVLDSLPLNQEQTVLDLYCGVGLFSLFLAQEVDRVIGVEASPDAAQDFLYNLRDFENVELYDLPVEEVLPYLKLEPDVILLDPPRAGISPEVLDDVVRLQPEWVGYISCDPATLGRDVQRFARQGYVLENSIPVDMFPQTYHIESVNILRNNPR
jgi:23S rRNA (uracil1939-C5)-methyltransferase